MTPRKPQGHYAKKGAKNIWHLYGLQSLVPAKFARVVNSILKGHHTVIGHRLERPSQEEDEG